MGQSSLSADQFVLYFIEVNEDGEWKPIGDVTFCQEDMPIVIGERKYRGKGIGKKVVSALVERGKAMGYEKLYIGEIYDFNTGSQKCFESVGFRSYEKTKKGSRYVLRLNKWGNSLNVTPLKIRMKQTVFPMVIEKGDEFSELAEVKTDKILFDEEIPHKVRRVSCFVGNSVI